jgi:predicted secreted hydrolase
MAGSALAFEDVRADRSGTKLPVNTSENHNRMFTESDMIYAVEHSPEVAAERGRWNESSPTDAIRSDRRPIDFAHDQGVHWNQLSEWWYTTGHLKDSEGRRFGFELCFFRVARFGYFVHVAVTDEANNRFRRDRSFYSPINVALGKDKVYLRYGIQSVRQTGDFSYTIHGAVEDAVFDLSLESTKSPMLVNGDGLIDMPEGTFSWYYSLTRLATKGTMRLGEKSFTVEGMSWMDHQWGDFVAWRYGWDWFSAQLDDGTDYNIFRFRRPDDSTWAQHVSVLTPDARFEGTKQLTATPLVWWKSPHTGHDFVTEWQIDLPDRGETLGIKATMADQEMFATDTIDIAPEYWEGSCTATRTDSLGRVTNGRSYAEHFPY